ncbi:hypothetical protein HYX13_01420 [Candidatus Woesearchaeota archaeon]|nr:hypothetical protein [Candidatus Woesearchaeota archaeon]
MKHEKGMKVKLSRRFFAIFFFFLFLFLLACGTEEQGSGLDYNFKQGIAELELHFLPSAPPEKLYPDSDFKIIIEVDNQMAYDIEEGKIWITGLVEDYFEVRPTEMVLQEILTEDTILHGKSLTTPGGEKVYAEFKGHANQLFLNAEEYTGTYFLKAKYRSRMEFLDTFCVNTHLYAVYDPNCVVEQRKTYSGQGAPIAISEVEEILTPGADGKVEFRIRLQNRGGGKVERVDVVQAKLGGEQIDCVFPEARGDYKQSMLFMENDNNANEATLICRKSLSLEVAYQTPLFVEFAYEYQTQEQHQLRMVR